MAIQLPDIPLCEDRSPANTGDECIRVSPSGTFLIETTNVVSPLSGCSTNHPGGLTANGVMHPTFETSKTNSFYTCPWFCSSPSRDSSTHCCSRTVTEGFLSHNEAHEMSENASHFDVMKKPAFLENCGCEREACCCQQNTHLPLTITGREEAVGIASHTGALVSRSIGINKNSLLPGSGYVYGGIASIGDVRSHGSSISFRSSSDRHAVPSAPQKSSLPKNEHIDTVVTKTNVEERLKFVDVDFIQEVEKFVEVPEVFYNDVVVEVPQVVNVVKYVPKTEIRERIKYVPKYEVKTINKYVEVPIIKVVDRYEEILQVQEVLKPVTKNIVVERPVPVMKKVPKVIKKHTIKEVPVPVYEEVKVPVYKYKMQPKILQAEIVNQTPHYIDIPVLYEKPV